ncbi:MAG TPA: ABC-2 family transporter protein [Acidimicrobiales bacterium]|nr:ABC-2 family transporter protein [Acidimicrobiales bacterium]
MAELWLRLAGARLRSELQYRTSFVLLVAMVFVFSFLDFVAVLVIFGAIDEMAGWSFAEVALLYGTSGVAFNLANLFVAGVDTAAEHIRAGTFDTLLLRPVGTIVQLTSNDIALRRMGRLAQASLVLVIALGAADVQWTVSRAVMVPVLLLSGAAIFGGIWVIVAAIAFWTVENRAIANSVTYAGNYLTFYPFDVFSGWLRGIAAIVPLAFVNYLPVAWILGKDDAYDWPRWAGLVSPLVALLTVLAARAVWSFALRRYRSTGT